MKKPYRLMVFDWEGTLCDTLGHVLNTLAEQARQLGFGELDTHVVRQYVSLGLVRAVKKLFPQLSMHQHEHLLQAVQHALAETRSTDVIFPGAKHLVQQMQQAGMDLAIATNRGPQSLQRALRQTGLDVFFKVSRAAGQAPPKPCPQMLEEIMDVFGVQAWETMMIGDSLSDIEMAMSAGVDVIGVDFYHHQGAELVAAGALAVFDDYKELANYLGGT